MSPPGHAPMTISFGSATELTIGYAGTSEPITVDIPSSGPTARRHSEQEFVIILRAAGNSIGQLEVVEGTDRLLMSDIDAVCIDGRRVPAIPFWRELCRRDPRFRLEQIPSEEHDANKTNGE